MESPTVDLDKLDPVRVLARVRAWLRLRRPRYETYSANEVNMQEFQKLIYSGERLSAEDWNIVIHVVKCAEVPVEYAFYGQLPRGLAADDVELIQSYEAHHEYIVRDEIPLKDAGSFLADTFCDLEAHLRSNDLCAHLKDIAKTPKEVGISFRKWRGRRDGR